jgi:hypothetical protein
MVSVNNHFQEAFLERTLLIYRDEQAKFLYQMVYVYDYFPKVQGNLPYIF